MNIKKLHPELGSQNRSFSLSNPSRLWFMSLGCKQVPLKHCKNIVRWGHPDGYFLKADGQKAADSLSESHKRHCNNHPAPNLAHGGISCHVAMALAFYGERPIYIDRHGKPYVGICHHLIPDLLDYRPANLLCWLTREQHSKADARQRALRKLVPDLHAFPIERLRILEDPRVTTDEQFVFELAQLRPGFILVDPAILDDLELTKHYDPFIERD